MLKMMSTNKFFTMILLSAITIMISVAFIFWGIGPKDNVVVTYVAQVEGEKITREEFRRVYDNEYKRLRSQNSDAEEIEKLNLKKRVLASLVDGAVLLAAARNAGITVTEDEIREAIMKTKYFQRDGVFDQKIYERALKMNRMSPRSYESGLRNDMITSKMSTLIGETAELTSEELKIIESLQGENSAQLTKIFRSTKTNQAVQVYIESIKRGMDIKINKDFIS